MSGERPTLAGEIARTGRLVLRTWTLSREDGEAGVRLWGDADVMRWVGPGQPLSRLQVAHAIAFGLQHQAEHGCQHWAVVEQATGEVIGACGFNVIADADDVVTPASAEGAATGPALELVVHIAKARWRQGFATESARAALDYAAATLEPSRITASHRVENAAAGKLLARLGFAPRGTRFFEDSGADEAVWEWRPAPAPAAAPTVAPARPRRRKAARRGRGQT